MKEEFIPFQSNVLTISIGSPVITIVRDEVEGDMKFEISLLEDHKDTNSYTSCEVVDSHCVNIKIFNAPTNASTTPTSQIQLGTYRKKYKLSMLYILSPMNETGSRQITIVFYKSVEE